MDTTQFILGIIGSNAVILLLGWIKDRKKASVDVDKTQVETMNLATKTYVDLLEEYKKREISTQEVVKRMEAEIVELRRNVMQYMQNNFSMMVDSAKLREKVDDLMKHNTELTKEIDQLKANSHNK